MWKSKECWRHFKTVGLPLHIHLGTSSNLTTRELGEIKNVSMGFVSGTAARRCKCKPSCRMVPTPWLDRMRKAGAVPASKMCQHGSLPARKGAGRRQLRDLVQKVRWGFVEKMSTALPPGKKSTGNKSLFYETDLVTIPLALDLSPSLTTTTDSSPDGQSALHKDRLTMGQVDGGELKKGRYCRCCQKRKTPHWTSYFRIKTSLKSDMACHQNNLIDLPDKQYDLTEKGVSERESPQGTST